MGRTRFSNISCLGDNRTDTSCQQILADGGFDEGALSGGGGFGIPRYPPSSVAPRLHCVAWRRLGSSYPLLRSVSVPDRGHHDISSVSSALQAVLRREGPPTHVLCEEALRTSASTSTITEWGVVAVSMLQELSLREARSAVLAMLTDALRGDALSAEYVLLAVLSRVYARHDETTVLGCIAIELCDLEVDDARVGALMSALTAIVPRCVKVCVDNLSLNSADLQPVKHEETNWMSRSALQLAAGTVLLLDSTSQSTDSQLNAIGTSSVEALRGVVTSQLLYVDCGYSSVAVPTDLPCLLFSTAFSPCDRIGDASSVVRISSLNQADPSNFRMISELEDWTWLTSARLWWAAVRLIEPIMAEDTLLLAEADFVHVRNAPDSEAAPLVEASDFHHWLTLARLLTLSLGEGRITVEHWRRVREMETERLRRFVQ
eukprot:gene23517-29739_t